MPGDTVGCDHGQPGTAQGSGRPAWAWRNEHACTCVCTWVLHVLAQLCCALRDVCACTCTSLQCSLSVCSHAIHMHVPELCHAHVCAGAVPLCRRCLCRCPCKAVPVSPCPRVSHPALQRVRLTRCPRCSSCSSRCRCDLEAQAPVMSFAPDRWRQGDREPAPPAAR